MKFFGLLLAAVAIACASATPDKSGSLAKAGSHAGGNHAVGHAGKNHTGSGSESDSEEYGSKAGAKKEGAKKETVKAGSHESESEEYGSKAGAKKVTVPAPTKANSASTVGVVTASAVIATSAAFTML
ncbi:hypothetical protein PINS_up008775 [Pythium insidiosum]|nr:hypothetical protein PINS_up008775 [Pythium insidiosum]